MYRLCDIALKMKKHQEGVYKIKKYMNLLLQYNGIQINKLNINRKRKNLS